MRPLFMLFVLFPLLELWLLLKVGAWLGALPTITLVVLSALLGMAVLRRVGWRTLSLTQLRLRQQASPVPALFDGFVLALAGVLLLLPGLLSDIAGLLLLIAPLRRRLMGGWLAASQRTAAIHAGVSGKSTAHPTGARPTPEIIEGEYRREP
jgi:UPF0716 protein FxsA